MALRKKSAAGEPGPARRRIRRKTVIILCVVGIILALLAGAAYAASRLLLGPAEGVVIDNDPYARVQSSQPVVELEQFEGTHLTFAYPDSYTVQQPSKDASNSLETHTLIASGMMNKIVTVTVTALPSGKLEDDSSYYMRTLRPEKYVLKTQTLQNEKVVVATDSQNSQQAAFWAHASPKGGKLLTFTITSTSINQQATAQEYQAMLESVRWR